MQVCQIDEVNVVVVRVDRMGSAESRVRVRWDRRAVVDTPFECGDDDGRHGCGCAKGCGWCRGQADDLRRSRSSTVQLAVCVDAAGSRNRPLRRPQRLGFSAAGQGLKAPFSAIDRRTGLARPKLQARAGGQRSPRIRFGRGFDGHCHDRYPFLSEIPSLDILL